MEQRSRKKPEYQLKIARERIAILLDEADKMVKEDKKLAKRYVELARKIGMRYNVRITEYKKKFCGKCHAYLKSGLTSKHRLKNGLLQIECLECKNIMRYSYKKK